MTLRIATDRRCWPERIPLAPMLQPLLGEPGSGHRGEATSWDARYDDYAARAASLFELTPVAECDCVVLPGDWYWVRGLSWRRGPNRELADRVRSLVDEAHRLGKPVALFFSGDLSFDRVPYPDLHVFRESSFRSRLTAFDHVLPAFHEDLVATHLGGAIDERPWRRRPTVGFCGLAQPKPVWKRALGLAGFRIAVAWRERRIDPSPYLGEVLRSKAIALLDAAPGIETNFVLRDHKVFFKDADTRDLVDVRQEYVDNLRDSDYVLCIRGSGNYSFRLYEALCMGRVPVIVDTDLALPLSDTVDWRRLAVWVDRSEIDRLPERVREFHAKLSPSTFVALQHELRELWLQSLSPSGFFAAFSDMTSWLAADPVERSTDA